MIATTVLLSICVMSHNDETTSTLSNRLNQQGLLADIPDESATAEQRRLVKPTMGVEGGPCRSGWQYEMFGLRCNWGLVCQHSWDGSAEYGICRPWGSDFPVPNIPAHPATGERGQPCNPAPQSPCNHSNLRAHYQQLIGGGQCVCELQLGSSNQDQASAVNVQSTTLGMRAPEMGNEGEPCRNTRGYECNSGLYCHYYTRDGSSTEGRCVRNSYPSTGNEGEPCNHRFGNIRDLTPCNTNDLEPHYAPMYPSGTSCTCVARDQPSPRTGEAGGRCNKSPYSPCNRSNLQPHYRQILPSGTSCTCVYLLGN